MAAPRKLIAEFYRVLNKLPNYGKILALSSVALLYGIINPPTPDVSVLYWYDSYIKEDADGKLYYSYLTPLAEKYNVPDYYVNDDRKPMSGDKVLILKPEGTDDVYLFKPKSGKNAYEYRVEAVRDSIKARKRGKMFVEFLMTATMALGAYPKLIQGLISLVKGKIITG